jgi:hypothetical protein
VLRDQISPNVNDLTNEASMTGREVSFDVIVFDILVEALNQVLSDVNNVLSSQVLLNVNDKTNGAVMFVHVVTFIDFALYKVPW